MLTATRKTDWIALAADLVSGGLGAWQPTRINQQLVDTFGAAVSAFCDRGPVSELWPVERFAARMDDINRWILDRARAEHPVLRYYLATGDWRVIQVADVPVDVVPATVTAAWMERGRLWGGVQHQLVMPLPRRRAFVVGRADPFTTGELDLAHQLGRLVAALDGRRGRLSGRPRVASATGLTPRELDVLALLAEGLTAAAIGRRLRIAERTVHKHLERSYAKLGVADRLGAVLRAQRIGLLPAA